MNVKRGTWTGEEDAKILAYVSRNGRGNWTAAPKNAGLKRCGKSCRLRYTNYSKPDLKHESFTPEEEELIVRLHAAIGSRWSIIAQQLPGRTDNDVKNHWNSKLKKKLKEMGIDHVTHKPFSQILADYGNIHGLTGSETRPVSLNREIKNAFIPIKPEEYQYHPTPPGFSNITINTNTNVNNSNSVDLLSQLQTIKLVTEASKGLNLEITSPNIYNDGGTLSFLPPSWATASSSSSSSTCSTAGQEKSTMDFSWQDFLLDDAFLTPDIQQNQEQDNRKEEKFTNHTSATEIMNINIEVERMSDNGVSSYEFPASTSTQDSSSFVEAMIDRENQMFLQFPDLLEQEQPFYN